MCFKAAKILFEGVREIRYFLFSWFDNYYFQSKIWD